MLSIKPHDFKLLKNHFLSLFKKKRWLFWWIQRRLVKNFLCFYTNTKSIRKVLTVYILIIKINLFNFLSCYPIKLIPILMQNALYKQIKLIKYQSYYTYVLCIINKKNIQTQKIGFSRLSRQLKTFHWLNIVSFYW